MTDSPLLVHAGTETEVAPRVHVIPDRRVNLVPNVGFVGGDDVLLVVDTGMGPANGEVVLSEARRLADGRRLLLTLTHFHPEHGFGAQSFEGQAELVYNGAQADELAASGAEFIELFRTFGPEVAEMLEGVTIVPPHRTYDGSTTLDLGGRTVELREVGGAHTAGDQVVLVPDAGVLFTGDLVENRFFPIVFGPANGPAWIETLDRLAAYGPRVVVPGHGEVGGPELIDAFRAYLEDVRDSVAERAGRGEDVDAYAESLGAEIRSRYADWGNDEWIDFAIRDFAARREGLNDTLERRFVAVPGVTVHCVLAGDGPAVLLLHQTPRSWDEYRDVIPLLAERRRVIAMDTVGFGDSSPLPDGEDSIERWASAAVALLDELGIERAALVGHHTGAYVATEIAASRPERVSAAVLSSLHLATAEERREQATARAPVDEVDRSPDGAHVLELWRGRAAYYPPSVELLERYLVDCLRAGDRAAEGHRVVARYAADERLPLVRCPVLFVAATRDPFAYPGLPRLRAVLPDAQVTELEGGIPLPDDIPDAFAAAVERFLDDVGT